MRKSLHVAFVVIPVLLLTAGLFSYLRLKMVHDRRAYHRFAEQTLVLSSQIAGRPVGPVGLPRQVEPVPRLSNVRPPTAVLAVAAAVLGIPLFAGSLAVAGVKLPDVANDPFERVGIELPNQEEDPAEPALRQAGAASNAKLSRTPGADDDDTPGQSREQDSAAKSSGGQGAVSSQGDDAAAASAAAAATTAPYAGAGRSRAGTGRARTAATAGPGAGSLADPGPARRRHPWPAGPPGLKIARQPG